MTDPLAYSPPRNRVTHERLHREITDAVNDLIADIGGASVPDPAGINNFQSWSYDPAITASTFTPNSFTVHAVKIWIPAGTVTNLHLYVGTSSTPTNSFMALYTSGGALLSQSANQAAAMTTTGAKTFPLSAPQVVTAGYYYVAHWQSGTNRAVILRAGATVAEINNMGMSSGFRAATSGTSASTVAPSPLGTLTSSGTLVWVAVS